MSLNVVHSSLNGISAFDREEQRKLTGWDIPDYSNDRVRAPADRAAFLDSFHRRYITKGHWHNLTMMKETMLDCMTLAVCFTRGEVVQHVQPMFVNSTRPNQMRQEPTPDSRGDIQASLSYAVTTCINLDTGMHFDNVVVVEGSGREIQVAAVPDALSYFDLLTAGLQYLKENDGKCKSGKALFDLVADRCVNFKMYCPWSKCDLMKVFKRECARILLVLSTTRTMTGHNEGLIALLFLNFLRGLNDKIEHLLTAGSNDKTTFCRPSAIYLNTIRDSISHKLYKLIMNGHKFCYKKFAAWYDRLFELREMEIDELQTIVESIDADVSACPAETTKKGTLVLSILSKELGNTPPAASSSSAGAARSTSSTRTSSGTSSSNTSIRQSYESRRREVNNLLYRVLKSPFTHSVMSEMVTTIVHPTARELELDQVVALVPDETLCAIFRSNNWSVGFADCLNDKIMGEDDGIANIALFGSDEFVKNNGSDDESGGELTIPAIELRIELLSDWAPSTQVVSSTQVTLFVWILRAHIHKQQYCRSSKYLVPSSGGSRSGDMSANADYTPLRQWLYCIIQDPQYNGPQFSEIPELGSPVYNLLADIGVCYNPTLFRSLVDESTVDNVVRQAEDDAKKRRLNDDEQSQANAAASGLFAKFGQGGLGG